MHIFKLSIVFAMAALAAAGYHHGGGSSYSVVTKHDAPVYHYGGGGGGHSGGYSDGGYQGGYAGISYGQYDHGQYDDQHTHPKYDFDYGVKDGHTGDHKSQWESRDGDKVKGGYMLHEADGTTRVVEYTADKHHGFNAVVKKIGHASHPEHYGHHNGGGYYGQDYGHGHGHGHASSYANVKQHHH